MSMRVCFSHIGRKPGNPNKFFGGAIQVTHVAASLRHLDRHVIGVDRRELYVWPITGTFWSPLCNHLLAKSKLAFAVCFNRAVAGVSA